MLASEHTFYFILEGNHAEVAALSPVKASGEAAPDSHGAAKERMRDMFIYSYEM